MKESEKRYVFGPAPSRRLGRSLGIDLIPFKTCTCDCIYCQVGRTTTKTLVREVYVPPEVVLRQLESFLAHGPTPDVITLAGAGEPTLHVQIGDIIRGIKRLTPLPVAVLTNGTLLFLPEVRDALLAADIVIPDLDAATPAVFAHICRPHPELRHEEVISGLAQFMSEYQGQTWVEVFLVAGVNDSEAEVKKIAAIAERIGARTVQLNTVTRPPAERSARSVARERLAELARLFTPPATVIADFKAVSERTSDAAATEDEVLALLRRRPCTLEDIISGLGLTPAAAEQIVTGLFARQEITTVAQGGKTYYSAGR